MTQILNRRVSVTAAAAAFVMAAGCGSTGSPTAPTPTVPATTAAVSTPVQPSYDVDALGVPQFVNVVYIDLDQFDRNGRPLINQISKFRSSQGHDFSDSYEACRSMKHYFTAPDESTRIYAPVSGRVVWRDVPIGGDINIQSDAQPAFVFTIMHPVLDRFYKVGDRVVEGSLIGHHVGNSTNSDIVVNVNDGKNMPKVAGVGPNGRLVSYFLTLTDSAFSRFRARGITSPADLIISKADRDASPIRCNGESFDPTWFDPLPGVVRF